MQVDCHSGIVCKGGVFDFGDANCFESLQPNKYTPSPQFSLQSLPPRAHALPRLECLIADAKEVAWLLHFNSFRCDVQKK